MRTEMPYAIQTGGTERTSSCLMMLADKPLEVEISTQQKSLTAGPVGPSADGRILVSLLFLIVSNLQCSSVRPCAKLIVTFNPL